MENHATFFSDLIKILIDVPRPHLTKAGFYFSKHEPIEDDINIGDLLQDFIQTNTSLTNLIFYIRSGDQEIKNDFDRLEKHLKLMNLYLNTKFEIVVPRSVYKKY